VVASGGFDDWPAPLLKDPPVGEKEKVQRLRFATVSGMEEAVTKYLRDLVFDREEISVEVSEWENRKLRKLLEPTAVSNQIKQLIMEFTGS
jgi:hypothetical protein